MMGFVQRVIPPARGLHLARMLHPARVLHPAWYHGHDKRPPFFEGWYFKLVDAGGENRYAIIPGIFKSDDPAQRHAFVQVLNGTSGEAIYHRFPVESFRAAHDRFEVTIGACRFTPGAISLQLAGAEQKLYGEVHFEGLTPWPVSLVSPGIMGPFGWLPANRTVGLETYHGVLSLDHALRGTFVVDGQVIDWDGGRGYIEKDWGASFPAAWIWMQSNHFEQPSISLTASVAMIPWNGLSFRGQIVGLWHEGHLYRFATYTGARIERLALDGEQIHWVLRGRVAGRPHRLEIRSWRAEGGLLRGPSTGDMGVRVPETLSARIEVRLSRLPGRRAGVRDGRPDILFEGTGRYAGLEAVGDMERLLKP